MLQELIKNKVYYYIFDKTNQKTTCSYTIKAHFNQDSINQVENNIKHVLDFFNGKNIFLLNQVHGSTVIEKNKTSSKISRATGDASLTLQKKLILAIYTADCVPVMLSSTNGEVIGAAHCGWRGAKNDIIKNLANNMRQKTQSEIVAIIGPSISQKSYEVSEDFYQDFIKQSTIYKKFFINSNKLNHYMFDIQSFVKLKIEKEGVKIIKHIKEDTYQINNKYPSYRRCLHKNEPYNQNILSAIMIK